MYLCLLLDLVFQRQVCISWRQSRRENTKYLYSENLKGLGNVRKNTEGIGMVSLEDRRTIEECNRT